MAEKIDWWKASAEECFAEAKERIAHAEETDPDTLHLSGLRGLAELPAEINRLGHHYR